jgi:putative transposase
VRANQASFPVATMCRLLEVSTSGYYDWRDREPSARAIQDSALTEMISEIHTMSRGAYGAPMIHAELAARGVHVGRKRVARLMKEAGLQGVSRRKRTWTTSRAADYRPAPDLVERDFTADGPNKLWVADITYVPTWAGFLYLAVVLDVWSRRVVGWAMANHLRTELVLDAFNMAIQQRRPNGVIHHSDQGSQYTSIAFGKRCQELGVRPSMGSVGDCYDNALCESFFASLECELIDRFTFRTRREARLAVFDWIEAWYNPLRRHSAIGRMSPANFERSHPFQPATESVNLSRKAG